nr:hypothetical protein [Candidatus Sigynarchaeum springense]
MTLELKQIEQNLEDELVDDLGLKDFEVDRIKERSTRYLGSRALETDLARSSRIMDTFLVGLSAFVFFLCVVFCWLFLGIYQFVLVYVGTQVLILAWRFVLSPLRHHGFASKELLVKYRCYLPQEKQAKAFLKDNAYAVLAVLYLVVDAMVFLSFFDMPRMLVHLNNMIYNRGEYPLSLVTSIAPALVIVGFVVNVLGAAIIAKYQRKERGTGRVLGSKKATLLLSIAVVASIAALLAIGIATSTEFTKFNEPAPGINNFLYYFDVDQPLYRARGVIYTYYFLVYAGAAVLALLIICGLSVMETTIMLGKLNAHWDRSPPVERNWEFKVTAMRHEENTRRKIRARKFSLGELLVICLLAIVAMWVCLKWGGEIMDIEWMNYVGYGLLGIIVIWGFILSPVYHAKNDGQFHYPTSRQNVAYAMFDERGIGSFKYYFKKVFNKQRSLVAWTLYFLLMLTAVFNFDELSLSMINWKDMFESPAKVPEGVIVDFVEMISGTPHPYETALGVVLFATAMSLVAFVGALGKKKEDFGGSGAWCVFFKVVVGLIVLGCFFWVTKIPQVTSSVDLLSMDFFLSLGLVVAFFFVAIMVILFLVMPWIIKFDNLGATKRKIVEILVMTIVLLGVIVGIFHFVLPMTDTSGANIIYGYPWDSGAANEVKAKLESFDLGVFLMEWCGRYIAWGGVQQFLFMSIFLTLWKKIFPRSKGYMVAVGTSCIFGVIHAIDWPLMIFTFVAGLFWAKGWHAEYYDPKTGRVVHGNNLFLWGFVHGFGGSLLGMLAPFSLGVGPFNMG